MAARIERIPFLPLRKGVEALVYLLRHLLNLPYTLRLIHLGLRYRVDLVQVNLGLGEDEAALLLRRPRVVFLRGFWGMGRIQKRIFAPGVKHFVAVSQYIADRVIEAGVPPDRVTVATPPVIVDPVEPEALEEARRRHGIPSGAPLFGIFGRIVPWKGQLEFLRAAALVLAEHATARALIVGDDSDGDDAYLQRLTDYARTEGITDRVVFTGYRRDVATYYAAMDVVVHASIEPEPSGRVIFEARSYGVPVLASHLGGPREFVEEGVDGFIVDPTDAETMASRLLTLLRDDTLRHRMGAAGRERVLARHWPEGYARVVEAVYLAAVEAI